MQTNRLRLLLTSTLISLLASALTAQAATLISEPPASVSPCSALMTELECGEFKTVLTQLQPGPKRDQYLAEHDLTQRERAAACSCNRPDPNGTVSPSREQALLTF